MDAAVEELRPSLGGQVIQWQQENLVHGQGAVNGKPYRPNLELQALTWMAYEVYPQEHRLAGRRPHREVFFSRAKGTAKTEQAGAIGAAELAGGPVRCDGFDANGQPVGVGVFDPDIPFLATTEGQAKDLAFTRARQMLTGGKIADRIYDGAEELQLVDAPGRLYIVTSRAKSKDGYIPTFAHADETHLFTTEELHELVRTVWEGLGKRSDIDGWGLQTTTAHQPGQRSVAEATHEVWRQIVAGEIENDFGLLFDHLEAGQHYDLSDEAQLREAILEAAGLASTFRNVDFIVSRFKDPRNDRAKLRRYWLNHVLKSANAWLSPDDIAATTDLEKRVRRRERIAIGFDGSLYKDSTVLIGCRLSDGHLFVIGIWEKPLDPAKARRWRVPSDDVDKTFRWAMREYDVTRAVCDLHYWQDYIDRWHADFGDRVVRFDTRSEVRMTKTVERLETAIKTHAVTHDGNPTLVEHLENARTYAVSAAAERKAREQRVPVTLGKEHKNSENKIDAAVGGCLAFEGRAMSIDLGLDKAKRKSKILTH